jgi:hypothetical protein
MSRPVQDRLRDLQAEVSELRVPPASIVRDSAATERGPRRRAVLAVAVLAVLAIAALIVALVMDSQANGETGCSPGATRANLAIPDNASEVKLRVLNGTGAAGTADQVGPEFRNRGFAVQPSAASKSRFSGVAIIKYGPGTVGAAYWIQAYFIGQAQPEYSAAHTSDVIDVVIGTDYRQLATKTEVNQALALLDGPVLPPGACATLPA